jgi:hypothetical protein
MRRYAMVLMQLMAGLALAGPLRDLAPFEPPALDFARATLAQRAGLVAVPLSKGF